MVGFEGLNRAAFRVDVKTFLKQPGDGVSDAVVGVERSVCDVAFFVDHIGALRERGC